MYPFDNILRPSNHLILFTAIHCETTLNVEILTHELTYDLIVSPSSFWHSIKL